MIPLQTLSYRGIEQPYRVDEKILEMLQSKMNQIEAAGIELETDLSPVSASAADSKLSDAIDALIENAISGMPAGGELTITLIDGVAQWELEVADTSTQTDSKQDSQRTSAVDAPSIIRFPATDNLRTAYRMTFQLGGEIQTWNCPLGGQAHVMVIPKPYQPKLRRSA